jgi:hypothetical protein
MCRSGRGLLTAAVPVPIMLSWGMTKTTRYIGGKRQLGGSWHRWKVATALCLCWVGLHRQVADCCQHGQRLLGCIKCRKCWPAERLLACQERFWVLLDGSFVLFRCTDWGPPVQGAMFGNSAVLMPSGHYMYRQFNIQQFYVLPTHCIYVFCVDLRTNSHYFPIQH